MQLTATSACECILSYREAKREMDKVDRCVYCTLDTTWYWVAETDFTMEPDYGHWCPLLFLNAKRFIRSTCDRSERVWRNREGDAACNIIQHHWFGCGSAMVWEAHTLLQATVPWLPSSIKMKSLDPLQTLHWCSGSWFLGVQVVLTWAKSNSTPQGVLELSDALFQIWEILHGHHPSSH